MEPEVNIYLNQQRSTVVFPQTLQIQSDHLKASVSMQYILYPFKTKLYTDTLRISQLLRLGGGGGMFWVPGQFM